MPIAYKFLKDPPLCYIRFTGEITLQETLDTAQRCASEPDFEHGLTHLFDFRQVTDYEHDFPKFFAMQARVAELYPEHYGEQLAVFCAPPGPAAEMVELARRTWSGSTAIVIRSAETWEEACDILGMVRTDAFAAS